MSSIYTEFNDLHPYFQSVRKLEKYLTFDMSFPKNWKFPKKYIKEESVVEQKSEDPNMRLVSFVSQFEEIGINEIVDNIKNIIRHNREIEAKEKLFNDKVSELKSLFSKQDLQSLHSLKFELMTHNLTFDEDDTTDIDRNGKRAGITEE